MPHKFRIIACSFFTLLLFALWQYSHLCAFDFGYRARTSWNLRFSDGQIAFMHLQVPWPVGHAHPGWNFTPRSPNPELLGYFTCQSHNFLSISLRLGPDWSLLALPFGLPIPFLAVILWRALRLPESRQPLFIQGSRTGYARSCVFGALVFLGTLTPALLAYGYPYIDAPTILVALYALFCTTLGLVGSIALLPRSRQLHAFPVLNSTSPNSECKL